MNHHTPIKPAALGLLFLAAAGSAFATDDSRTIPAEPVASPNSQIELSADYYNYDSNGESLNLYGSTVEYAHTTGAGNTWRFAVTGLCGTNDTDEQTGTSNTYSRVNQDYAEIRASALFSPNVASWLAFGTEYIHRRLDSDWTHYGIYKHYVDRGTPGRPDLQWDGTTNERTLDSGSESSSFNELYLKTTLSTPAWALLQGSNSKLTLALGAEAEAGYVVIADEDDGYWAYNATAKARLAYERGSSVVFLESGYRYEGELESGGAHMDGLFGRAGFAYRW